jgi:hypothetical protein
VFASVIQGENCSLKAAEWHHAFFSLYLLLSGGGFFNIIPESPFFYSTYIKIADFYVSLQRKSRLIFRTDAIG